MKTVTKFPRNVSVIENTWIPMPDGTRLAARIWLPEDAEADPVPALLELLPYRKRDFMRARDEPMHHYFAGHGYASVRVDVRGSGDSDGLTLDEYTETEHDDATAVIEWLAARPWCTGAVGMFGISWGGFNALQVAARQPPALKAILTLCAADDRYADDAHYMGGCLLNENLIWGSSFFMYHLLPPDPEIVGERWREMWLERLENAVLFPAHWLRHQHRDDYWKHGSVCEDYAAVRCPVYAIGGWADGYSNAVPRLLEGLSVPCKGLIGPWAHVFPHNGVPGPAIGFLQEALRWWDHWLKDIETGIMDEPVYRVWMQDSLAPQPQYDERPGRWVGEPGWPSSNITPITLALDASGRLVEGDGAAARLEIASPPETGMTSGNWCAFGSDGEMPIDQRQDDGRSLVFDGEALEAPLEIMGAPVLHLVFDSDRPVAQVIVRLNDLFPDGSSARVSYGVLNLTHRESHEHPSPLQPGKRSEAVVRLNDIAHRFAAGNRLRVAISTAYWPIVWPAPEPATLGIHTGSSSLVLPVRAPRADDAALPAFPPPETGPSTEGKVLRNSTLRRTIERDLPTGDVIYRIYDDGGEFDGAALIHLEDIDLEAGFALFQKYSIGEADPAAASGEIVAHALLRRGAWAPELRGRIELRATKDAFIVTAKVSANEGLNEVFAREWRETIPRDLV
ncbi:MAG TPA: CocE/NonD family hydrolase [Alphaproteobacteria bacterium]|nr:CocE/NonD family hydrolase [Alphaproteobacteria bacterium]